MRGRFKLAAGSELQATGSDIDFEASSHSIEVEVTDSACKIAIVKRLRSVR
jgi:hypothetical protein